LRDAAGHIVRWFGTCTDIDDQRRATDQLTAARTALEASNIQLQRQQIELAGRTQAAESALAALAASETRFRTVQDAAPTGFGIQRPVRDDDGAVVDFEMTYVNEAGARMFGSTPGASVGGRLLTLSPGAREVGLVTAYTRVLRTGQPYQTEVHYHDERGLDLGIALTAVRVGAGADAEIAVSFADVTARQRADADRARLDAELAVERERLRSLILHVPAAMALLVGPEHVHALVNDASRRRSGGGRDVTGLTLRAAFPELARSDLLARYDHCFTTGESWTGPETLVRYDRDGTAARDTWFDLRLEPLRDADGRVVSILSFAVEVTSQVRARHEIERLLADAERARADADVANQAKGAFLAVMSHELRTPLNAIGGYTELMQMGIHGPITPEQATALERVQRSQRHLLGLINEVLNYAKIDAGHVEYSIADVDLDEALATCEALIAPQVRAKGLHVVFADCPTTLRARADADKLQQIVLNLLSNAVKFTEPGGRIELSGAATYDLASIRVTDTGIGIAPGELARVFEPFVQVDVRLTRTQEGTGLGLAISRDLARGMGGDLTVESIVGVGPTFTLTLPAVPITSE
jgi:PAS domain S-box-containing protein